MRTHTDQLQVRASSPAPITTSSDSEDILHSFLATLFVGGDEGQAPEPPAQPESPTRAEHGGRRRGAGRGQRGRRHGGAKPQPTQPTQRRTDLDLDLVTASQVLIEAERANMARSETLLRAERQHFSRVQRTIHSIQARASAARPR